METFVFYALGFVAGALWRKIQEDDRRTEYVRRMTATWTNGEGAK